MKIISNNVLTAYAQRANLFISATKLKQLRRWFMKTLEQMAKEQITKYMMPIPAYKFQGFPLDVAVKKAKATRIGWDDVFDKLAKTMAEA
jgi:uncharacterized protein YndB with AHSA1/START domain